MTLPTHPPTTHLPTCPHGVANWEEGASCHDLAHPAARHEAVGLVGAVGDPHPPALLSHPCHLQVGGGGSGGTGHGMAPGWDYAAAMLPRKLLLAEAAWLAGAAHCISHAAC